MKGTEIGAIAKSVLPTYGVDTFSITQILREINFGELRSSKTAGFCHFGGSELCKFGKFQASKMQNS